MDREIIIRPCAQGGGFDVVVHPSPWPGLDRHGLKTVADARRAATSLAVVHRWPVKVEGSVE